MISIQNILVPVDFSEASLVAAEYAASLAQAHKARLYVLHDASCSVFVVRSPQNIDVSSNESDS